jgi:hypothetical protein
MQLTAEQVETWDADPNQFVVDEDDDFTQHSARHAAQGLLLALCEGLETPAAAAVLSCAAEASPVVECLV